MNEARPKHSSKTFAYGASRAFERASFYGLRTLLLSYLLESIYSKTPGYAFQFFGWFVFFIMIAKILGATVGDFLLGAKRSIILGGFLQMIGCFVLCYPSDNAVFIGLSFIV